MKSTDWLLLFYIFKWANFWTAPTWLFVCLWTLVIWNTCIWPTIHAHLNKAAEEAKSGKSSVKIFGVPVKVTRK